MNVSLPKEVVACLEGRLPKRAPDEVERSQNAILLYGGMGPCWYVTRKGVFLIGADSEWGEPETREATQDEVCAILVGTARRFGMPELLTYLPPRPFGAFDCANCSGNRWDPVKSANGEWPVVICGACSGRGWES